jgi:S-DNA-T family DNA segregation ATPase FtsK/SpoIIIE
LLTKPAKKVKDNNQWVQRQIDILDRTFEEFKVGARVKTYTKGPTVTRYEIELESGVYVKKVTGITNNIKMALAAKEIRIEAPIPGKSTIGIEVPNEVPEIVHFYDIVSKEEFRNSEDPLTIALGLDIDGLGVYSSISKMPHGLVAGATGSGKSVCINTILMSLLFRYSPDELKLMLIDPKMVELSAYNELPHLITPVITDAKIATAGLKWAVEEMEKRFQLFSNERVRDIASYNQKALKEDLEIMPYIVIIVDELADLMMIASSSVEEAIMRLTQKARACGIHLIIATQRPSTDVIKGTIKSNIPTRIAFMVSSYIDSMTIIDGAGADKLLGRGDMLYAESGKPQRRVQGAYISDIEIANVNEFIRRQRSSEYLFTQEKLVKQATSSDNSDELLGEIARFVVISKAASINKISKQYNIGFNRAQKIVETLHEMGIVSDNVGSKARSVLVTIDELEELLQES